MKIVLLGKDGQVGWELQRALAPLGEVVALGRAGADLEAPGALVNALRALRPDVIVNAAAYTAVDQAEREPARAARVNAEAPGALAALCAELGILLIHYSTDYVFDGTGTTPYVETDATGPLSVYGQTKLAGEQAIAASGCSHLIFRTSWVFAARGGNFAKTMLRLAAEREALNVVADQFGAPTSAELIADVTALCLYRLASDAAAADALSGIYHLVAAGETHWADYARFVIAGARTRGAVLRMDETAVRPIATADYPLPAPRPANSRLATGKLCAAFGVHLPHWSVHAGRMLDEIV